MRPRSLDLHLPPCSREACSQKGSRLHSPELVLESPEAPWVCTQHPPQPELSCGSSRRVALDERPLLSFLVLQSSHPYPSQPSGMSSGLYRRITLLHSDMIRMEPLGPRFRGGNAIENIIQLKPQAPAANATTTTIPTTRTRMPADDPATGVPTPVPFRPPLRLVALRYVTMRRSPQ